MVKSPVPETDKGPLRRSRRTESVPLLSTPSSSTATKRSRKKRGDVDRIKGIASLIRRLIYQAKSNVLALTFSNLITFSETNGRLARQNRRSMRAQKRNNALQQEIQHNADAILAVQNNTVNVVDSERGNDQA
ncbi:hypothetical protein HID58_092361, partial [Brassica napus]